MPEDRTIKTRLLHKLPRSFSSGIIIIKKPNNLLLATVWPFCDPLRCQEAAFSTLQPDGSDKPAHYQRKQEFPLTQPTSAPIVTGRPTVDFASCSQSNCFHLKNKNSLHFYNESFPPTLPGSSHKSIEWRGRRLGWQREETYRSYSLIEGNVHTEWQATLLEKALLPQVLEQVCSSI